MLIREKLLEKWAESQGGRYRVLLVLPKHKKAIVGDLVSEFLELVNGRHFDFATEHKGQWGDFFTWNAVREKIFSFDGEIPVIVTGLEPFYSKWPVDERLTFLKSIIRSEPLSGLVVFLYCKEELTQLAEIESNNRGVIWAL
ncbi:MAG: hypothetical protein JEZ06_22510 [Anaerolineaceae bacterium]|nr:hypothetical protein [Anaerolineaceae bacterium]